MSNYWIDVASAIENRDASLRAFYTSQASPIAHLAMAYTALQGGWEAVLEQDRMKAVIDSTQPDGAGLAAADNLQYTTDQQNSQLQCQYAENTISNNQGLIDTINDERTTTMDMDSGLASSSRVLTEEIAQFQ